MRIAAALRLRARSSRSPGRGAPAGPSRRRASRPERRRAARWSAAKIHTELGVSYYEAGKLGVALEELNDAISADKTYAPAWNARALVHMDLKEDAEAERDFKQALKLDPASSDDQEQLRPVPVPAQTRQGGRALPARCDQEPALRHARRGLQERRTVLAEHGRQEGGGGVLPARAQAQPGQPQALFNMAELEYGRDRYAGARNSTSTAM